MLHSTIVLALLQRPSPFSFAHFSEERPRLAVSNGVAYVPEFFEPSIAVPLAQRHKRASHFLIRNELTAVPVVVRTCSHAISLIERNKEA